MADRRLHRRRPAADAPAVDRHGPATVPLHRVPPGDPGGGVLPPTTARSCGPTCWPPARPASSASPVCTACSGRSRDAPTRDLPGRLVAGLVTARERAGHGAPPRRPASSWLDRCRPSRLGGSCCSPSSPTCRCWLVTRQDAGRHQAVPLPRPGPADRRCRVDVGQPPVRRLGAAPDHRLPVAVGAVVLDDGPRSACPTGWPSGCGSARCCSSAGSACAGRRASSASTGAGALVAAFVYMLCAVHAPLRLAHLGDAAAVGRGRLGDRADDPLRGTDRLRRAGATRRCSR